MWLTRPWALVEVSTASAAFGYQPSDVSRFFKDRNYVIVAIDDEDPLAWTGDLKGSVYKNVLAVPAERSDRILELLRVIVDTRRRFPTG